MFRCVLLICFLGAAGLAVVVPVARAAPRKQIKRTHLNMVRIPSKEDSGMRSPPDKESG